MKTVLVTGATGFIGKWSIPELCNKGYEVHAITSGADLKQDSEVQWHTLDLLEGSDVDKLLKSIEPSHLLHFSWYTRPPDYWDSVKNISWLNASLNLLTSFFEQGGSRVVSAGTCAEYDWKFGYCSEFITPLNPKSVYGMAKVSLFKMQEMLAKKSGCSSGWGRIFFLYGPGEHPDKFVPGLIKSLYGKKGDGSCNHVNQIRDYMYVKDVASAFVAFLESSVAGPVNIASGSPTRLGDIASKIQEIISNGEHFSSGNIPFSKEEYPLIIADIQRLNREVGWIQKTTLDEGLSETIDWWTNNIKCEKNKPGSK